MERLQYLKFSSALRTAMNSHQSASARGSGPIQAGAIGELPEIITPRYSISKESTSPELPATTRENKARLPSAVLDGDGRGKVWQWVELGALVTLIAMVWVLLLLPVVFYYLPGEEHDTSGSQECAAYSDVADSTQVCREALQSFQGTCLSGSLNATEIHISPTDMKQQELEDILTLGLGVIRPSPECEEVIVPFLCLYYLRLCDGEGEVTYHPSADDCVEVSTEICPREWAEANELMRIALGESLPSCEELQNDTSLQCDILGHHEQSGSSGSGSRDSISAHNHSDTMIRPEETVGNTELISEVANDSTSLCPRQCRDDFYCASGVCLPRCDRWATYPDIANALNDALMIMSALIGLLTGTAVVILSCIRRTKMLAFPSIIVVYDTITVMILMMLILVSYMDRTELLCSSIDLMESVNNPTPFCTSSGAVLYYVLLQLPTWWCFHILFIFWKIRFPFHARNFTTGRRLKYIHISCVAIGLLFPLTPVTASFTKGGYMITSFPPFLCGGAASEPNFYGLVLPTIILIQIGLSLLLITLWTVHKKGELFRHKMPDTMSNDALGTAERKIFLIFCYYAILGTVGLTTFSLSTIKADKAADDYYEYFLCESRGIDPGNPGATCDKSGFQNLEVLVMSTVLFFLIGYFPAINIIFAVSARDLKQLCRPILRWWQGRNSVIGANDRSSYPAATSATMQ